MGVIIAVEEASRDGDIGWAAFTDLPMENKTINLTPGPVAGRLPWLMRIRAGAGLANLGNSCYLNALLQCLASLPQFRDDLLASSASPA